MTVQERRHGEEMYLPLAIFIEDLPREVAKRLPEGTPVPCAETLRIQFHPINVHCKTAAQYKRTALTATSKDVKACKEVKELFCKHAKSTNYCFQLRKCMPEDAYNCDYCAQQSEDSVVLRFSSP